MFRVIHPNRWYFWAIALLIIFALFLIASIFRTNLIIDDETSNLAMVPGTDRNDPSYLGWKVFSNEQFGLSVKYPPDWQLEIDPNDAGTIYLENPNDFSENLTIAIVSSDLRDTILENVEIAHQQIVEIDSLSATWLKSINDEDVATSNIVFVETDEDIYYVAGSANQFEKIIKSIKLLKRSE